MFKKIFNRIYDKITKAHLKQCIVYEFEYVVNKHFKYRQYPIKRFCDNYVTSIKVKHNLFNNKIKLYLVMKNPGIFIGPKGKDINKIVKKINESFPKYKIEIAEIKEHKLY